MAGKKNTWIWIIVGVIAAGILCIVALAAGGLWFVKTHMHIDQTASAPADFDAIHRTFAGQKPLIELDDRGRFLKANTDRPASATKPTSINVVGYDPRGGKTFRMNLPFWLLRLKSGGGGHGRMMMNGQMVDLADLHLTVADLERFGPALIVDHEDSDGTRVLVWTQ